MSNIDINKNIDELLKKVHGEELTIAEKRYEDETAQCLTFARTRSIALGKVAASEAEGLHLRSCPHCSARLQSFHEQLHPLLPRLLLSKLGRLAPDEQRLVQSHLDEGCEQCRRLLGMQWMEKAAAMLRAGQRTVEQMSDALLRALSFSGRVPVLSFNYESEKERRQPFAARLERSGISVMLEETDADELFVRVFTRDASFERLRVHLEVAGEGLSLQAEVTLEEVDDYYQGVHYFPDFSLLAASGKLVVLAVPVAN